MNFSKIQREKNKRYSVKFDSRGENITALKQMQTTSGCIFYKTKGDCLLNFGIVLKHFEICVKR